MSKVNNFIITEQGLDALTYANESQGGVKLNFTHLALGQGENKKGYDPTPSERFTGMAATSQTALKSETARLPLSKFENLFNGRGIGFGARDTSQNAYEVWELALICTDHNGDSIVFAISSAANLKEKIALKLSNTDLLINSMFTIATTENFNFTATQSTFMPSATTEKEGGVFLNNETVANSKGIKELAEKGDNCLATTSAINTSLNSLYTEISDEVTRGFTSITNNHAEDTGAINEKIRLGALPIGSIIMWSSHTPPDGWLICDGSEFLLDNKSFKDDLASYIAHTDLDGMFVNNTSAAEWVFENFPESVYGPDYWGFNNRPQGETEAQIYAHINAIAKKYFNNCTITADNATAFLFLQSALFELLQISKIFMLMYFYWLKLETNHAKQIEPLAKVMSEIYGRKIKNFEPNLNITIPADFIKTTLANNNWQNQSNMPPLAISSKELILSDFKFFTELSTQPSEHKKKFLGYITNMRNYGCPDISYNSKVARLLKIARSTHLNNYYPDTIEYLNLPNFMERYPKGSIGINLLATGEKFNNISVTALNTLRDNNDTYSRTSTTYNIRVAKREDFDVGNIAVNYIIKYK